MKKYCIKRLNDEDICSYSFVEGPCQAIDDHIRNYYSRFQLFDQTINESFEVWENGKSEKFVFDCVIFVEPAINAAIRWRRPVEAPRVPTKAELQWTTDKPTIAGPYWYRENDNLPKIGKVFMDLYNEWVFSLPGEVRLNVPLVRLRGEFFGPIKSPA